MHVLKGHANEMTCVCVVCVRTTCRQLEPHCAVTPVVVSLAPHIVWTTGEHIREYHQPKMDKIANVSVCK